MSNIKCDILAESLKIHWIHQLIKKTTVQKKKDSPDERNNYIRRHIIRKGSKSVLYGYTGRVIWELGSGHAAGPRCWAALYGMHKGVRPLSSEQLRCCCSVPKSCLILCDPVDRSPPRPLCPPLSPRVCSNSCSSTRWCYLTISSSATPFSSCLQSFPASGSFPGSQLFTSGGQSIGATERLQWYFYKEKYKLVCVLETILEGGLEEDDCNSPGQRC